MFDFLAQYFTPLDKSSCVYFLILTIIFFVAFVVILFSQVLYIIFNFKKLTSRSVLIRILFTFNLLLGYFVNRLLYSICISSLH